MDAYRRDARIVGVLYILATILAIVGGSLLMPLEEAGYLAEATETQSRIALGALLEIGLVVSVVGIAVMFFPVLKRENEGIALGYVGARTLEAVFLAIAAVSSFVIMTLALDSGVEAQSSVDLSLVVRDWTYLAGGMVFFGLGGLILYPLLYRARLVPRWLSLWGLIGVVLILGRAVLEAFGVELSGVVQGVLAAPIAIQEMVMAVWLIWKGFDLSAFVGRTDEARVLIGV